MIITDEKRIKDLADNVVMRTQEVYYYDINIANYEAILHQSESSYPDHIVELSNLSESHAIEQCPLEDLAALAELQQRNRIAKLIRTEIVERTKSNSLLQVLDQQLHEALPDQSEYDAAIQDAITRRG